MRRALAGLAGLAVVGALVLVARTAIAAPILTLQPTCGGVGVGITATGSGWVGRSDVTIKFDQNGSPPAATTVAAAAIGPNGDFKTTLTVPSRPTSASAYPVVATQPVANAAVGIVLTATASFYIPCPGLIVRPTCGSPGQPAAVHGEGFRLDDPVEILFTPPAGGKPLATTLPRADSTFDVSIVVPADPPGTYTVGAFQIRTQVIARAEFQIPCVKAVLKLVPNVGPPGTVTTVTGTGFPVGAVVKLRWSQGIPLAAPSITIDATQGFQLTVLIYPHDELGLRHLSAGPDLSVTSAPLFNIVTADFLVVPGTMQPKDLTWRR